MTDPDAPLVDRALRGDTIAFGELMQRHERTTYNLALRVCIDPEDARDATQDAFMTVFRKLDSFRGDSAFSTWLHRVTVNASLDLLRKKRRTPVVALSDDDGPSASIESSMPGSRGRRHRGHRRGGRPGRSP